MSACRFQKDCTLVSCCPRREKTGYVLSPMHHADATDEETCEHEEPEMMTLSNITKLGVNLLDHLIMVHGG
jgi:hypothetical protein